jgi:hypothetical protein
LAVPLRRHRQGSPGTCTRYDPAMRVIHSAGVAALVLLALSSCGTPSTPTGPVPAQTPPARCHGEFVADVDTSVPGEATPEAAAVAWASSERAPSGAPTVGWKATDTAQSSGDLTVNSGDWTLGLTRTVPGGWVVSGLRCGN